MIELTDKVKKRFDIQLKKIYVGHAQMKKVRPVLNQVHYTADGHVQITNSHVGVRLAKVHDEPDSDGAFPEMHPLFRIPDEGISVELNEVVLKELENQANVLFKNKIGHIKLQMSKETILMTSKPLNDSNFIESGLKVNLDLEKEIDIGLNPRYLHDALNMFRMMDATPVTLYYVNELRPIHLVHENLHYLITPIRTSR